MYVLPASRLRITIVYHGTKNMRIATCSSQTGLSSFLMIFVCFQDLAPCKCTDFQHFFDAPGMPSSKHRLSSTYFCSRQCKENKTYAGVHHALQTSSSMIFTRQGTLRYSLSSEHMPHSHTHTHTHTHRTSDSDNSQHA
jgi:hypothetical protein